MQIDSRRLLGMNGNQALRIFRCLRLDGITIHHRVVEAWQGMGCQQVRFAEARQGVQKVDCLSWTGLNPGKEMIEGFGFGQHKGRDRTEAVGDCEFKDFPRAAPGHPGWWQVRAIALAMA